MPAYNAELTLHETVKRLPHVYDEILLCDDASKDKTVAIAQSLGLTVFTHQKNSGYGGNQKTLYQEALRRNAEIIIMVHPDNQYDASNVADGIRLIEYGEADFIIGNRMSTARKDGMPFWRYVSNRFLTLCQNFVFHSHMHELHSGLRIYRASMLRSMPFEKFSDDFVFDSETIAWAFAHGFRFGEIPARCYYGSSESSISFTRSVTYGLATLKVLARYLRGYYNAQRPNA